MYALFDNQQYKQALVNAVLKQPKAARVGAKSAESNEAVLKEVLNNN